MKKLQSRLAAIAMICMLIVGMFPAGALAEEKVTPTVHTPTSIELNKTKLVLHPDDSFTLVPTTSPKGLDVTFTPGNNGVVSVDENGFVTALRPGKGTVTVSVGGDGNYLRSEAVAEIDVVERADLLLDPVAPVEPDGNVTINGRLLDKDGKGIGGQTIKIRANPNHQGEDLTNEYLFPDVQTAEDGSLSAVGSWKVPDQFILEDFDVTVSLDSEDYGCEPKTARVSVVNPAVNVTGSIVWDDGDNIDGRRPEKTWLKIRRTDGDPVRDKDGNSVADLVEIAGTKGTKLSATWEDLLTHADIGGGRTQRVSYEVVEAHWDGAVWTPGGYEKLASGDMESGFVITNRYIPLQTDIVVTKVWEDNGNAAGKRPESVKLHLDQKSFVSTGDDDIKDVAAALTADETGGWKALWQGLPYNEKKSGQFTGAINYQIREDAPAGYTGAVTQTGAGLRAELVWADGVNEEDKPASITATLINEAGDASSRTAVLSAANNWTCTFDELIPNQAASYTVSLFPALRPELGYLQLSVIREYTLTNTLIPTIELTIDTPKCGTVVDEDKSYPFNPADGSRGPEAQSNRPVGSILASGWEFVKSDADQSVDWLKWGPFASWEQNPTMTFPITLTGGSSYNALGRIVPVGGTPVPAAFSLVVNGQELPADRVKADNGTVYFAASIEAEHTLEKQARKDPSCSEPGYEEHWKCTSCGKLYSDENGQNEIAEPAAIDKLPHTPGDAVRENEVPATSTKEGSYDEVVYCTACREELSRVTHSIPKRNPAEISYRNTKGDGATWTKGSGGTLDFTFKRSVDDEETFGRFTGIKVDGTTVDEAKYTAESGSVIIKLKPAYLETLSAGEHTLTVDFDDGSAEAAFHIIRDSSGGTKTGTAAKKTASAAKTATTARKTASAAKTATTARKTVTTAPKTGDQNHAGLWLILMGAAAAILICVIRRNKETSRPARGL